MKYSYTLDLANDTNPYYVNNPIMFKLLLYRVINNPQHYAPTKAINKPLRDWMNNVTSFLCIHKIKAQTFMILNGITNFPYCKQCGKTFNDKNFKDIYFGFRDFCCKKCRAKWNTEHWTQEQHETLSKARKYAYQHMSKEKKLQFSQNISNRLRNRTPKQKNHTINAYKQTCANRTLEERAIVSKHISDALNNISEEKKALKNKRISDSIKNMDPQKKAHKDKIIGQKNHQNWQNKSEEEKEAYREARRIGAANRTQETINAMVKACTETKRKNKSFNTSKPENEAFHKLIDVFGTNDVIQQYKCNAYPFNCDFYITSLNLFIECNYFWQHGKHPFDPNNENDIKVVEKWKSKSNDHKAYEHAIYVWTQLDVKKQQIAKDNKLNYQAFYSTKDFNMWIESFKTLGESDEKTI